MTQDDIIKMAREAELYEDGAFFVCTHIEIERFAQLVAAHEREECAKVCDQQDHDGVMIAADCAEAIRARENK